MAKKGKYPPPDKIALSVGEAAALLGISTQRVYELVHVAGFPAFQPGWKRWIVNRRGLQEWLDKQTGVSA